MLNAAVLGSPIGHSLSPVLHRAGYEAAGLTDWRYTAHEVTVEGLTPFLVGCDETWRGLSLTMPLKEAALQVAATVDPLARALGAANTLVRRTDGGWDAVNTDVHGLQRALAGVEHEGRATVLGAGATARSAVLALHRLGVTRIRVAARRREPAAAVGALVEELSAGSVASEVVPLAEWAAVADPLVVSTLPPAGGDAAAEAVAEPLRGVLLDVVYAGWPTSLARASEAAGARVISGLAMLVHQAAAQFELFTGVRPAPVAAMRAAGEAALRTRSA